MMNRFLSPSALAALAMASCFATSNAQAQLQTFYGLDAGASTVGTQAAAAQAAFLSATTGEVVTTFESSLPASVTIGSTGGSVTSDSSCAAALCGFNTTIGGSQFLLLSSSNSTATITFAEGTHYFGAFFSGLQLVTSTLQFSNGSSQSVAIPNGSPSEGGVAFTGFYDPSNLIYSVTISVVNDIVAVDDLIYTRPTAPVPEPATWATMALGIAGIWVRARRRVAHAPA